MVSSVRFMYFKVTEVRKCECEGFLNVAAREGPEGQNQMD